MLERLDRFFLYLAKKMILIAAFFGIDRKRLAYIYAFVSPFLWLEVEPFVRKPSLINIQSCLFFSALSLLLVWMNYILIRIGYREDDIVSSVFGMNPSIRIFFVGLQSLLGLKNISLNHHLWPILIVLNLFFPYWLVYILMNQSPTSPVRLKSLVKSALGKINQAFRPAPQPHPELIPLRFSFNPIDSPTA